MILIDYTNIYDFIISIIQNFVALIEADTGNNVYKRKIKLDGGFSL